MEGQNIKSLFAAAEKQREGIESAWETNTDAYQQSISAAVDSYKNCLQLVERSSLFSPNETVEDINSGDLQYLTINYRLAEVLLRVGKGDRKAVLAQARSAFEEYLGVLEQYEMLSKDEEKLFESYTGSPTTFSTIPMADPNARRGAKVAHYKQEKALKQKLEFLAQNPAYLQNDEHAVRELQLTNIALCTHNAFQSLETLNRELEVLAMAPPAPRPTPQPLEQDHRERSGLRRPDEYSDRLDGRGTLSSNNKGPILSANGKPLRPFTLLDSRQTLQEGVFRPGHNLPTMTIDEYLEEERARGGIIEGGGEASGIIPEPEEDNYEKGDAETMKAREWDEFVEANPKGAGNTLNRG